MVAVFPPRSIAHLVHFVSIAFRLSLVNIHYDNFLRISDKSPAGISWPLSNTSLKPSDMFNSEMGAMCLLQFCGVGLGVGGRTL